MFHSFFAELLEKCSKINENLQILKNFACGRHILPIFVFIVLELFSGAITYIDFSKMFRRF